MSQQHDQKDEILLARLAQLVHVSAERATASERGDTGEEEQEAEARGRRIPSGTLPHLRHRLGYQTPIQFGRRRMTLQNVLKVQRLFQWLMGEDLDHGD